MLAHRQLLQLPRGRLPRLAPPHTAGIVEQVAGVEQCWGELFPEEKRAAQDKRQGSPLSPAPQAVLDLHRGATFRGSDVRLSTGVLADPTGWPRQPMDVARWKWRTVVSYAKSGEHINSLELYAVLVSLRWRFRAVAGIGKRAAHFIDSQVVQAVLTKGRSSSRLLMGTVRSVNALMLGACCYMVFGYIHTADNPADAPSRWAAK